MRAALVASLLIGSLLLPGCLMFESIQDPMGRQHSFEDAQRKYTHLVRWGELERASQYVDAEQRAAFIEKAPAFADIRITDYETGAFEYSDEGKTVAVTVRYRAYSLSSFVERPFSEKQVWHRAEGMNNHWTVQTALADGMAAVNARD